MATYKNLLSEKDFLKVAFRARALSKNGTNLYAIAYRDNMLYFKTRSASDNNLIYTQRILLTEVSFDKIISARSFKDVENLIKNGDIKVSCNCPAFLYWGFKYKAWKNGYGIEKELRRPLIRNPYEQGYVCKHLYLVLQVFPYLTKALSSKFYKWAQKKVDTNPQDTHSSYLGKYNVSTTLTPSTDSVEPGMDELTLDSTPITDTNTSPVETPSSDIY